MQQKDQCDVIALWLQDNWYKCACLKKTFLDTLTTKNFGRLSIGDIYDSDIQFGIKRSVFRTLTNMCLTFYVCALISAALSKLAASIVKNHIYWGSEGTQDEWGLGTV